jgi:hypothetical protein
MDKTICIGYDSPHPDAFAVCRHSLRRMTHEPLRIIGLQLDAMQRRGWYKREVQRRFFPDGSYELYDPISEHPMSTEFAISRFLAPFAAGWKGWAVFMDCDMLAMMDIGRLFELLDPHYALMCVQPRVGPLKGPRKMDNKTQSLYQRKLWSSLMAFNCEHQANRSLTLQLINGAPGRDLHRFCWLEDSQIGALPAAWNWMEGITDPQISPSIVHFTEGGPWLKGFDNVEFADEWRRERALWIAGDGIGL